VTPDQLLVQQAYKEEVIELFQTRFTNCTGGTAGYDEMFLDGLKKTRKARDLAIHVVTVGEAVQPPDDNSVTDGSLIQQGYEEVVIDQIRSFFGNYVDGTDTTGLTFQSMMQTIRTLRAGALQLITK